MPERILPGLVSVGSKPRAPRLRQAVLAAADLESVAEAVSTQLGVSEPFADPGVAYFGLRNSVFGIGDQFLEVISPTRPDTAAARLIERRGGDCGYMLMLQVDDLEGARQRARELGIREVFEVALDDIAEVHLHPADIRGAIVSLSTPDPPEAWRWGGPDWRLRASPGRLEGAVVAVRDPAEVEQRWRTVLGAEPATLGIEFTQDQQDRGVVEIAVSGTPLTSAADIGGVRFRPK